MAGQRPMRREFWGGSGRQVLDMVAFSVQGVFLALVERNLAGRGRSRRPSKRRLMPMRHPNFAALGRRSKYAA